jgi:hypothetical protein
MIIARNLRHYRNQKEKENNFRIGK